MQQYDAPSAAMPGRGQGFGFGGGRGMGTGRGGRRGRGFCGWAQGQYAAFPPEDEAGLLEARINAAESGLKAMRRRLEELKEKKG